MPNLKNLKELKFTTKCEMTSRRTRKSFGINYFNYIKSIEENINNNTLFLDRKTQKFYLTYYI